MTSNFGAGVSTHLDSNLEVAPKKIASSISNVVGILANIIGIPPGLSSWGHKEFQIYFIFYGNSILI